MAAVSPIDEALDQRNISRIVRMLMARDDITQQQLGEHLGVEQPGISGRLRGSIRWTVADLRRLAVLFNTHPGAFFTDPKDFTPSVAQLRSESLRADSLARAA